MGGWSATARNAVVDAIVDPQAGLGYNIFRYNIGGGENPAHEHMRQWGEMPGFLNASGTWDWNADANQRNVLRRIVERDPNAILEAFSNSPPYWMTKSGCASGNTDGSNNLKDDSYDAFADYLTEVVKHYKDTFGITFRTLEPLNEPNANWWTANGSQEGCHFAGTNQQQIIKAVGASLTAKGLTGTTIGASDENSLDEAYNIMRTYDAATLATMSQMNGHSYNAGAGSRPNLRMLATSKNKKLWQSESGPLNVTLANNTEAAMFMAGRIITDLRDLQPEAWLDWQVGDPANSWASIGLNDSQQTLDAAEALLHARRLQPLHPSRGDDAGGDPGRHGGVRGRRRRHAGRRDSQRRRRGAAAKSFTFDLTAVPVVGAQVAVYRTSQTENLASLAAIPVQSWSFTVSAPAFSLTTLVIPLR